MLLTNCAGRQVSTTWGGSVHLAADGTYYMYVAEMGLNCSLDNWYTNSQVAVATSTTPLGPYKRVSTVVGIWAHNPEVIQVPDGTYVLYTLGNGVPNPGRPAVPCSSASEALPPPLPKASSALREPKHQLGNSTVQFTLHYSTNPLGPFLPYNATILDFPFGANMNNWYGAGLRHAPRM
jgi:hypothetical protein